MLRRRFEKRQLFIGKKNQLRIKRRIRSIKRAMLSGQTAVLGEFLRMKSTRAICLWEKLTQ
jgi:hypothetical protein